MLDLAAAHWSTDRPVPADRTAAPTQPTMAAELCAQAPRLRRLVHRLLGWRAAANDIDDVVQDTLLAALRHQNRFRGESSLATWVTRIALRKAHDHVNGARRRRRLFAFFGLQADQQPHVGGATGDDERLDATRQAMQLLEHGDREVLVLRYLEQRGIEEIADLLQCTRAAVDARLTRARRRLRDRVRQENA